MHTIATGACWSIAVCIGVVGIITKNAYDTMIEPGYSAAFLFFVALGIWIYRRGERTRNVENDFQEPSMRKTPHEHPTAPAE